MHGLSISRAWEQTRAILTRDGRLFASVALALVALPSAVLGLVSPSGISASSAPAWVDIVAILASLIALAGQLAMIHLALTPGETVGAAIGHGARRMPIYFLAILLIVLGLLVAAIPFGALLAIAGVPLDRSSDVEMNPAVVAAVLLYMALIVFVGVRMIMAAPVASAEGAGVVGMLKRSWQLTAGHWWRLFGFVVGFFIATLVALIAVAAAAGVVAGLLFGPVEPLSASALIVALAQSLVNAAVTVFFTVMLARIYAQLAGRDEAQPSVPSSGT